MRRLWRLRSADGRTPEQERGQSLIELALILPILMMILSGAIDLGRAYYAYITVTNAAREGARYGADYQTDTAGIIAAAQAEAAGSAYPIDSCTTTVSTPNGTTQGNPLTVTVSCNFQLITGTIVGLGQIRVQNSATMVILPD